MQYEGLTRFIIRFNRNERRYAVRQALYLTGRRREKPKAWQFNVDEGKGREIRHGISAVLEA